jgi:hypothetical protein
MDSPLAQRLSAALAGVKPSDVPVAIAVHELLGVGILAGAWALCYRVQPVAKLSRLSPRLADYFDRALAAANRSKAHARAEHLVAKLPPALAPEPTRLALALIESVALRKAAMPVTVPLKFWAAYEVVRWRVARRGTVAEAAVSTAKPQP